MPLVTRNPGDTIRSLDVDQYAYALTGTMADQPLTLPQTTVRGTFAVSPVVGPTITSAPFTGTAGGQQWWFAIVPNVFGVDGPPGPVFRAPPNAPSPLSVGSYFTVNFPVAAGATAYKLIGGTGVTAPAWNLFQQIGVTIAASAGLTTYAMLANATGIAYTVQTAPIGGGVTNPWRASVHCSAPQADTNSSIVALHLDTVDYDPSGSFYTGTVTYTCPAPGIYQVSASFTSLNYVSGDRSIQLWKNGGPGRVLGGSTTSATGGNTSPSGSTTIVCNAGDTIALVVKTPGTTPTGIGGGWADFVYLCPL